MERKIQLKPLDEVWEQFKELLHRQRRRFLRRNLLPCPENCKQADIAGRKVLGCPGCQSHNPEHCRKPEKFIPLLSKEELYREFQREVRDKEVLVREYRDLFVLLWLLGGLDDGEVDTEILTLAEDRTSKVITPVVYGVLR